MSTWRNHFQFPRLSREKNIFLCTIKTNKQKKKKREREQERKDKGIQIVLLLPKIKGIFDHEFLFCNKKKTLVMYNKESSTTTASKQATH